MEAFAAAALVVVLAELGDKTQLLAMAFAAKYRWQTVMAGYLYRQSPIISWRYWRGCIWGE